MRNETAVWTIGTSVVEGLLPSLNIPPQIKDTVGETWITTEAALPSAYFIILTLNGHVKHCKQHNKYYVV